MDVINLQFATPKIPNIGSAKTARSKLFHKYCRNSSLQVKDCDNDVAVQATCVSPELDSQHKRSNEAMVISSMCAKQ